MGSREKVCARRGRNIWSALRSFAVRASMQIVWWDGQFVVKVERTRHLHLEGVDPAVVRGCDERVAIHCVGQAPHRLAMACDKNTTFHPT